MIRTFTPRPNIVPFVLASTIFLSAFLLFFVEPLIAKKTVPWFGGSAAVWSTCLVFFQVALLFGYLYSRLVTRLLPLSWQGTLHAVLLFTSLLFLPVGPTTRWKPVSSHEPAAAIFEMLTATLGLPFILLSATSPLLQNWLARREARTPYRLFALSNFASLAALLSYPFLIEPTVDTNVQSLWWSLAYLTFVFLCGTCAWLVSSRSPNPADAGSEVQQKPTSIWSWQWFALSACGAMLLLSITNHIAENVAAVPLLWVLPLAVYLLTFILAFGGQTFLKRSRLLSLLALTLGILAYGIHDIRSIENIVVSLVVFLFGLFVCCFFCHSELHHLRPPSAHLTAFYLAISIGGAIGTIFVGLVAPSVFNGIYELPLTLIVTAVLTLFCIWPKAQWPVRTLWIAVVCCLIVVFGYCRNAFAKNTIYMNRSFYGSLRVVQSPHAGEDEHRTLYHGTIEHGAQFLLPPRRFQPITYYGPKSGIAVALHTTNSERPSHPKHIGIIGLGVGTIAAYGKPGDVYRFYEINPQVIDVANSLFTYLRESKARIEIVEGDARLSLERERSTQFDVIAVDAFSGDAIPVHLLTREAFAVYTRHLVPERGVLAFHVSNRYLDLAPIVRQLAEKYGFSATLIKSAKDEDELIAAADWVLVSKQPLVFGSSEPKSEVARIPVPHNRRPWTDNYNNLFQALRMPNLY